MMITPGSFRLRRRRLRLRLHPLLHRLRNARPTTRGSIARAEHLRFDVMRRPACWWQCFACGAALVGSTPGWAADAAAPLQWPSAWIADRRANSSDDSAVNATGQDPRKYDLASAMRLEATQVRLSVGSTALRGSSAYGDAAARSAAEMASRDGGFQSSGRGRRGAYDGAGFGPSGYPLSALQLPSVKLLDHRVYLYRLRLKRDRVHLVLTTRF